jgi:hypothetical protein
MKNRLTILVVCMICSSARATSPRMCGVAEREACFNTANELCLEAPVAEYGQCLRDLREECIPDRSCPLPPKSPSAAKASPDKKGFPDKKPSANDILRALEPRNGPLTRGLQTPKEEDGYHVDPIQPIWRVPRPRRPERPND